MTTQNAFDGTELSDEELAPVAGGCDHSHHKSKSALEKALEFLDGLDSPDGKGDGKITLAKKIDDTDALDDLNAKFDKLLGSKLGKKFDLVNPK